MKRVLLLIFILAIVMSGCNSSKKQLEKGNYDAAIEKAVKQLRKDRSDKKQIPILESAYKIANFPREFEDDLLALDLPRLNSEWVEYHTQNLNTKVDYDYFVNISSRALGDLQALNQAIRGAMQNNRRYIL